MSQFFPKPDSEKFGAPSPKGWRREKVSSKKTTFYCTPERKGYEMFTGIVGATSDSGNVSPKVYDHSCEPQSADSNSLLRFPSLNAMVFSRQNIVETAELHSLNAPSVYVVFGVRNTNEGGDISDIESLSLGYKEGAEPRSHGLYACSEKGRQEFGKGHNVLVHTVFKLTPDAAKGEFPWHYLVRYKVSYTFGVTNEGQWREQLRKFLPDLIEKIEKSTEKIVDGSSDADSSNNS